MEKPEVSADTQESKKTLRQQYLLEKERIKYEIGDLEQIRLSLGYSQRRMCQLLLVDPSAWTRWTKSLSGAPPHIYQALKWLVELKKVNPEAAAPTNLSKRLDYVQASTDSQIKTIESDFETALKIQEHRWALAVATLESKLMSALAIKARQPKVVLKKKAKIKKVKKKIAKPKKKLKSKKKIKRTKGRKQRYR